MPSRTRGAKSTNSRRWSFSPFSRKKSGKRSSSTTKVTTTGRARLAVQLLVVVAVAGIGFHLLTGSHAATQSVSELKSISDKKAAAYKKATAVANTQVAQAKKAKAAATTADATLKKAKQAVAAAQKTYDVYFKSNGSKTKAGNQHPAKAKAAKDALAKAKSKRAAAQKADNTATANAKTQAKQAAAAQQKAAAAKKAAAAAKAAYNKAKAAAEARKAKAAAEAAKKAQQKAAAAKKAAAAAKAAAKKADAAVKKAKGKKAKAKAEAAAKKADNKAKVAVAASQKAAKKAAVAQKAVAAMKQAQKAEQQAQKAQQKYDRAHANLTDSQQALRKAQQALQQAQQSGNAQLVAKAQAQVTSLQHKVAAAQKSVDTAKTKLDKATAAAKTAQAATVGAQRNVIRAAALEGKAVKAADACDLLGRKVNPVSSSGCQYGQHACITGAWVAIVRNDGTKSGYCTGYINPNMTQDKCNKLGRHYVADFGCARRADRTSKNGAPQCLPGYNYIAAAHNKGADRCVQATVVEGKVKKAGAQAASGMETAGKHNDPATKQSCSLLGRKWQNGACSRVCMADAGALLMSSSKDTPANQYYCQKASGIGISQNACVNLYHRVWLGYTCARRPNQKSANNAIQCQSGFPYYLANSKASPSKGLDICSPTKAIALQNQKNGITGQSTASPLPTVVCADGSAVDATTKQCADGKAPVVTCAQGTVVNNATGMCELQPGVQMLCPGKTTTKPDADTFTCGTGDNQVNVVLLIPNCPRGSALTDDGTACQGTATAPSQPTSGTVTVDTSVSKAVCVKLLGRLWMPAQKQKDGTKSPAGCSVGTCQDSKNKLVANKDGESYCKGYITKITQTSCAALHRLWVLSARGCANDPHVKNTDVRASQCAGAFSVYVARKGQPGQCMKPSTVQKLQKVADSVKGGTIDKVLDVGKHAFCSARHKVYSNGACVKKPKHVNHAPAPSSHEPTSHTSHAPNGASWTGFCASLGRSAAGNGCSAGCNNPNYSRDASTASAHYGYDKCVASSSGGTALSRCLGGAHSDSAITACYVNYGSPQQKCLSEGGMQWVDGPSGMHCVSRDTRSGYQRCVDIKVGRGHGQPVNSYASYGYCAAVSKSQCIAAGLYYESTKDGTYCYLQPQ